MSHKDLFPLDSNDCIGSLIIFVGLVIATSGGIGGGGIIVPVLLLFFHFDSRHAIPLSNITIFGASIVNLLFNARRQHPLKKESLIDWDAVLVMEPLTMIGAIVGSLLNRLLPNWLILSSLDIILLFLAQKLLLKGIKDFKNESALILEKSVQPCADDLEMINRVEKAENGKNPGLSDFEHIADRGSWDTCGDGASCSDSASGAGSVLFFNEAASSKRMPYVSMSTGSTCGSSSVSSALQTQDRRIGNLYSTMPSEEASMSSNFDTSSSSLLYNTVARPFVRHHSRDGLLRCRESFEIDASEDNGDADREKEQGSALYSRTQEYFHYGQENRQHGSDRSNSLSAAGSWSLLSLLNRPATKLLWISILFLVIIFLNLSKCAGSETLYWGINGAMLASVTLSTTLAGLLLHTTWKNGIGTGSGTGTSAGMEWRPETDVSALSTAIPATLYSYLGPLFSFLHHEAHVNYTVLKPREEARRLPQPTNSPPPSFHLICADQGHVLGSDSSFGSGSISQHSQAGGIQWSLANTIFCPVLCIFAGIFAGIWGIGGGFIKGPLLLYLAAHPMAAAATSATMIFFTSLVATTSYFAFGDIIWDYSAYMFCLGAAATVVGQTAGSWALRQGSRSSVVPLSMGCVMLLSALLVTIETLNFELHSEVSPVSHSRKSLQFPPPFSDLCSSGRE